MQKALSRKNLWESSPRWIKNSIGRVLGLLPTEVLLGGKFRNNLRFVSETEQWTASQTRTYQLQRLKEIFRLAYEKTGYYRDQFDKIGFNPEDFNSFADMAALPFSNKSIVTENLDRMLTRPKEKGGIDYVVTGGTSGSQLHFYIDAGRSSVEFAYLTTSWKRCGYEVGIPTAFLRGQIVHPDRYGLRHEYDPILRRHYYSNFHMDEKNIKRYLQHIESIGPCFLLAYPSSAFALAQFIEKTKMPFNAKIKGVLAGSETVYPDQRKYIEEALGCRFFSWYGHSEKLVMAAECESSSDYHVWPTYGYCELIAEDGSLVRQVGQRGEIVGTGFINTCMPFIRYRTGDYAEYGGNRCEVCGRETMILRNLEGRWPQGDLVAKDSGLISLTTVVLYDDIFDKVRDYQFRQAVPGRAILSIIPLGNLTDTDRECIVDLMNKRLQGQIVFELEVISELKKTGRGKILRMVQEGQLAEDNTSKRQGAE
jgi:phenylacetate-CoA ligase